MSSCNTIALNRPKDRLMLRDPAHKPPAATNPPAAKNHETEFPNENQTPEKQISRKVSTNTKNNKSKNKTKIKLPKLQMHNSRQQNNPTPMTTQKPHSKPASRTPAKVSKNSNQKENGIKKFYAILPCEETENTIASESTQPDPNGPNACYPIPPGVHQ